MSDDKAIEQERYDARARAMIRSGGTEVIPADWHALVPLILQEPYDCYQAWVEGVLRPGHRVLEIGCGVGAFTGLLLNSRASVCALDISPSSLEVLRANHPGATNLETRQGDMEALPFPDGSFDLVASAGSLSYGDNATVLQEIYRVLCPGGQFICVDSFDHNPIYRLNRWLNHLRGERTTSTLQRMPTLALVEAYRQRFGQAEVRYFGSITWLAAGLQKALGPSAAAHLSAWVDRTVRVRRSAFKIVMKATKQA